MAKVPSIDPTQYPQVWLQIGRYMHREELKRLFSTEDQAIYVYEQQENDEENAGNKRKHRGDGEKLHHPLVKLKGLDQRIQMECESAFIRAQVKDESHHVEGPSSWCEICLALLKGQTYTNPIGRLLTSLEKDELMFRYRIDKEAFGSKEIFEEVFHSLEIDPKSEPIKMGSECFWFSGDDKTCFWCEEDPRETDDYNPRYFEFTGLRSRVLKAGDYVGRIGLGDFNIGPQIVWGSAPWNKKNID